MTPAEMVTVLYNQARNTLNKEMLVNVEIRVTKRTYAKKLEDQFTSNDSASVWKALKAITKDRTPSPSTEVNQQLAEDLNEFPATPLSPLLYFRSVKMCARSSGRTREGRHQAQMV